MSVRFFFSIFSELTNIFFFILLVNSVFLIYSLGSLPLKSVRLCVSFLLLSSSDQPAGRNPEKRAIAVEE